MHDDNGFDEIFDGLTSDAESNTKSQPVAQERSPATEKPLQSIFQRYGYLVISEICGVYRLQSMPGDRRAPFDGVGLLYSSDEKGLTVQLFLFEAPTKPGIAERIQKNWGGLDARRLGESGLYALTIDQPNSIFGPVREMPREARPGEEDRIRYMLKMENGDLLCLN